MSQRKEYPDKKSLSLYKSEHVEPLQEALDKAAEDMDGEDEPPETECVAHIARRYLEYDNCRQFRRLKDDQRIQEAKQAVASDHSMNPEDVSLNTLLKVTCSAYCGYQQTSDWRPENVENGGFKSEVDD